MPDTRNVLEVLKAELAFLEKGGYRQAERYPWRPHFVFEDSPTCINFEMKDQRQPCKECLLIQFVPTDRQNGRFPCRNIPLTGQGETITTFYESGTELELENALRSWLRREIARLEQDGNSSATHA